MLESAWKESNLGHRRTRWSLRLFEDAARTIELHAEQVRPVGFEPTLCGDQRVRPCPKSAVLLLHYNLMNGYGYAFQAFVAFRSAKFAILSRSERRL